MLVVWSMSSFSQASQILFPFVVQFFILSAAFIARLWSVMISQPRPEQRGATTDEVAYVGANGWGVRSLCGLLTGTVLTILVILRLFVKFEIR